MKVAPSTKPLNVPDTASPPSLAMIVNVCPRVGVKPKVVLSVALPRLTVPVTLV